MGTVGSKPLPRQDTSGQFSRRVKADNGYCTQPVVACAKLLCDAPACIVIQLDPAPTCSPVYAQTPSHTYAILPHPSPSSAAGPGLVVSLCSEQGASFPHPVFYDKYQLCSGSVDDGWKIEEGTCPSGLQYNPSTQQCDEGERAAPGTQTELQEEEIIVIDVTGEGDTDDTEAFPTDPCSVVKLSEEEKQACMNKQWKHTDHF